MLKLNRSYKNLTPREHCGWRKVLKLAEGKLYIYVRQRLSGTWNYDCYWYKSDINQIRIATGRNEEWKDLNAVVHNILGECQIYFNHEPYKIKLERNVYLIAQEGFTY